MVGMEGGGTKVEDTFLSEHASVAFRGNGDEFTETGRTFSLRDGF